VRHSKKPKKKEEEKNGSHDLIKENEVNESDRIEQPRELIAGKRDTVYCTQCGALISTENKFCVECGAKIE